MAGSSALFFGSNIGFDPRLQFLSGTEGHHAPRADRDLLAGLGVTSGTLVFVAQIEITEAGELYLLAVRKSRANFLEEEIHELPRFPLVETELVEQRFRHLRLGQGHLVILVFLRSSSRANPPRRK